MNKLAAALEQANVKEEEVKTTKKGRKKGPQELVRECVTIRLNEHEQVMYRAIGSQKRVRELIAIDYAKKIKVKD